MRAFDAAPSRSAPSVNAAAKAAKNSVATVADCASPQWRAVSTANAGA